MNKQKKSDITKGREVADIGFDGLVGLFEQTQTAMQTRAARSVDSALVVRNWLFGWYIVEFEKSGSTRKELYGHAFMPKLSERLTKKLGKGFSRRSLDQFRRFYESYKKIVQAVPAQSLGSKKNQQALPVKSISKKKDDKKIWQALPAKSIEIGQALPDLCLSLVNDSDVLQAMTDEMMARFALGWTHYVTLLKVKNRKERQFYELEALENGWGYRELDRQINSALYERLALSRDKGKVKELSTHGQLVEKPSDVIKSPFILEFTGLEERNSYSEHELETAIIDKIELFLLELGKGFLFESRQKRFTFGDRHFFVDLVFYNRLLRSYVIVDLKIGELKHQDLGQMQMYVNYFDRHVKTEDENPTVGILLCLEKNDELVELTLPENANIYASEYQLYLPSKEELKKQLEEAQREWEQSRREGE